MRLIRYTLTSLVSLVLAGSSFILAYNGIPGWGWFLAGSIATFVYPDSESDNDKDEINIQLNS